MTLRPSINAQPHASNSAQLASQQHPYTHSPLLNSLHAIAHQLWIESTWCLRHDQFGSLKLDDRFLDRFQSLAPALQHQYLRLQLRDIIHAIYYSGLPNVHHQFIHDSTSTSLDPSSSHAATELENRANSTQTQFYQDLHTHNSGNGYFDRGWRVVRQEPDGLWAVEKQGLTLHIAREAHLTAADRSAAAGAMVAIWLPRNLLEPGWYIAVGNAGLPTSRHQAPIVNLHFNLKAEGAVALMQTITEQCNQLQVPFGFKVPYDPSAYDRYDAGLLQCDKRDYPVVQPLVQQAYQIHQAQFNPTIPFLTQPLAPGFAYSEEPLDRVVHHPSVQDTFGCQGCQTIADALITAKEQGIERPAERLNWLRQAIGCGNR